MINLWHIFKRGEIVASLLALALLWSGGWTAVGQTIAPPAGASKAQAKPAVKSTPATSKRSVKTPAVPVVKKSAVKAKAGKSARAKKTTAGPPVPTPKPAAVAVGRRDPFRIPVPGAGRETIVDTEEIKGPLPAGTRGLLVGQLRLEGIVRQDLSNTMIAVVANPTNRAYFLRENDAVYNGVVSKITPDSVYFKVNYLDSNGHVQTREVVKRLSSGSGEGR